MFTAVDDYIIIMDMNDTDPEVPLTLAEMKLLRGAGVQTLYFQAAFCWDKMQPHENAPLDWYVIDRWVEMARTADLKMLLPVIYEFPDWMPAEYFYQPRLKPYAVPRYENEELTGHIDDFIGQAIRRYSADDVQVIYALPGNGEFPLDIDPYQSHPDVDMQALADWIVDRQRPLADQHQEVWTAYHPYNNPPDWLPIYGTLFSEFPFMRHYGIIFTYVQWKNTRPHVYDRIAYNQNHNMVYYGGTEYMQGIRSNRKQLMDGKMRMLTAPKHPFQKHRAIEPWMLATIEWALERYNEVNP